MNTNKVELICLADMSYSMTSIESKAVESFDSFLNDQKKLDKDIFVTLAFFDDQYELKEQVTPINQVNGLYSYGYTPRGNTALLDAIGKTVDSVGERLSKTPENERPQKVIVVIQTDGEENDSRQYTLEMIKEKIKLQTNVYKWEFMFLGAGLPEQVQKVAFDMGIKDRGVMAYTFSLQGVEDVYTEASSYVTDAICDVICEDDNKEGD